MGANIITGYTGTRHITPAMDAAVYRSTFGPDSYILSDGNQLAGSMPSVNEFTVLDGLVSMQGHQIQVTQETLSVDTCANGYKRIDLVCMRFEHDNNTQIDSASLIVIKGAEVADPNDPVVPDYNEGDIDSGASIVDFPLYQIDLDGSTVTFQKLAQLHLVDFIVEQGTSQSTMKRFLAAEILHCQVLQIMLSSKVQAAYGHIANGIVVLLNVGASKPFLWTFQLRYIHRCVCHKAQLKHRIQIYSQALIALFVQAQIWELQAGQH